jgi:tungstate transport system substrate-binding protein
LKTGQSNVEEIARMKLWPMKARVVATLIVAVTFLSAAAVAQDKSIVVASTTSTQDSGLFG